MSGETQPQSGSRQRIDKWLFFTRMIKSRSLAQAQIQSGHVRINGERVHPDVFMRVIVEKVTQFQPTKIAAEAQAAQEFFVHKLKEALRASGYPANTRVKEIHQRSRKELRIEALIPDIENGTIQFTRRHSLLLEQFELYGSGTHDDLPDALEMAVNASKTGRKRITDKPAIFYR